MKNGGFYVLICSFMIVALALSSAGLVDREKQFMDTVSSVEQRINGFSKMAEGALDAVTWTFDAVLGDTDYAMFSYYKSLKTSYSSYSVPAGTLEAKIVSLYQSYGYSLDPKSISGTIPTTVVNAVYLSDMYSYVFDKDDGDFIQCLGEELGGLNKVWCWLLFRGSPDVYGSVEYKEILAEADANGTVYYKDGWENHFLELFLDKNGNPYYSSP